MVLGVSGGARTRHVYTIATDLGIPTGGLAHIAGASEEQNEKMLLAVLAKHGGVQLRKLDFWDLCHKLSEGMIPVMIAMPPYHYWEPPPRNGRIPENGSDLGLYVFAETLGAQRLIYLKDQDGLYTADPAKDPKAKHIPYISVDELLAGNPADLILDRTVLETMVNARHITQVQVVNGLINGNLTRALAGEPVGTIISAS